jgi:hypothetical protein
MPQSHDLLSANHLPCRIAGETGKRWAELVQTAFAKRLDARGRHLAASVWFFAAGSMHVDLSPLTVAKRLC